MELDAKLLNNFNLNLFTVFEAVIRTGSFSKASEILEVSVASVSKNIDRLREDFEDPLFVRVGRNIEPTAYALELSTIVAPMLERINAELLSQVQFDPKCSKQQFSIYAPKIVETAIAPQLLIKTQSIAPQVGFEWQESVLISPELAKVLRQHKAHVAFDIKRSEDPAICSEILCTSAFKLVCSPKHPRIKNKISLEQFKAEYHAAFLSLGVQAFTQNMFSHYGIDRKIRFKTGSVFSYMRTIHATDLVGLMPVWALRSYQGFISLKEVDLDFDLPELQLFMLWHKHQQQNLAQRWLLEQLRQTAAQLIVEQNS